MIQKLGIVKKILNLLEWKIHKKSFTNSLENIFSGKTVAIVGNSPELIGANLGSLIDMHDLVIRVNGGPRIQDAQDFGDKTDCVVLGSTFTDVQKLAHRLTGINENCIFISTSKNKLVLETYFKFKKTIYFPMLLPQKISKRTEKLLGNKLWDKPFRPPRSGFVAVACLSRYSKSPKISIFGMSKDAVLARKVVNDRSTTVCYDERVLLGKHCEPAVEIRAMLALVASKKNLTWVDA